MCHVFYWTRCGIRKKIGEKLAAIVYNGIVSGCFVGGFRLMIDDFD